jgi:pentatricopeptide repeat protein
MAREVLDELLVRDTISWNALIGGYAEHGHALDVLQCFEEMQVEGVCLNAVTFIHGLKACSAIDAVDKGERMHAEIERRGLLDREQIGNTLVNMYAKCGLLAKSQQVFEMLRVRDVVSWTALLCGYAEHVDAERALACFEQMQAEGITPNAVTLICALKACRTLGAAEKGQLMHAEIERQGLLDTDVAVGNSLVDMYARCGLLGIARKVFEKLAVRDVVSWNALIAGYAEQGQIDDALKCFDRMQLAGMPPNLVTFVCCLKACARIGASDRGAEIHAMVETRGLLAKNPIGNTLVDMYAKCGLLGKAQQVFEKLPMRDVVTWTALMSGYARIGESDCVFHSLDEMLGEGVKPNPVTFLVVLNACSRRGLFGRCQTYFEAMSEEHGIAPTVEHLGCMVDLLGRAGRIHSAFIMAKRMPFAPNIVLWRSVLGACRSSGNVSFGKHVFGHEFYISSNTGNRNASRVFGS